MGVRGYYGRLVMGPGTMVKAEKMQRDVKEEERKRERNGGEGVFIPFQWLKTMGQVLTK